MTEEGLMHRTHRQAWPALIAVVLLMLAGALPAQPGPARPSITVYADPG
jgi:hypothetical protein